MAALVLSVTVHDISSRARNLHFNSIVVDTHADTTQRLLDANFDLSLRNSSGSVDIPRMREGGIAAIFFAIWISSKITGPRAVKQAIDQIDAVREQIRRHPADLTLATTADEIRGARGHRKIAILIGVEGGQMIDSDLAVLRTFAALGVRYMTLTHTGNVDWADSSGDVSAHHGLTEFGKSVIREMNRLGMIVDISHVSDKTFYDVLAASQAPLLASHSSCRARCDAPRNLTDEMIRALAAKSGVIQINYHVAFLSQEFRDAEKRNPQINDAIAAEIQKRCQGNEGRELIEGDRLTREFVHQGRLPQVAWSKIVEHIDHAVQLVGPEHVGLGSDFDGANMPFGMEDATHVPKITDALLNKGYSEDDVKKILGENTLRVMAEVQRISHSTNFAPQK